MSENAAAAAPATTAHTATTAGTAATAPAPAGSAGGGSRPVRGATRERALAALEAARRRTLALTDCLDEAELTAQHSKLMSPLAWDLAHVGNQEDIWLLREAGTGSGVRPDLDDVYDAFQTPRADRPALPMLSPDAARAYIADVRARVLEVLAGAPPEGADERLFEGDFVFGMVAQHEQQHDETMLATHQLRRGPAVLDAPDPPAPTSRARDERHGEVLVPAGPFTMGTSDEPWALDNERPAHTVEVAAFRLDAVPVTNGAYQRFIDDGGYRDPRWWHPEGWEYVQRAELGAPLFWRRDEDADGMWVRRRFGYTERVPPGEPVMHVSWYEADAYARWAGRRLPTEAEWEKAARHDPETGVSRRYPWGDADPDEGLANLGQRHLRPAPAGAYAAGAAPCGARQLIGDVWEWTSSDFTAYPGFAAFPYREYSEVFFGDGYKVLRGGSFGTAEVACRGTFRNWDLPLRRQIFAGFRTARDADAADTGASADGNSR
ncbi:ergothioneine biosynthesis protein EgtB [Streptomyces nanshensis]|uniref:Hercynine oxygenase n=1 Tax=Streptomyces nanshensis TaxID=518642 RepID=A0A1E7L384_9ACTN|nr:ergothioneine biosynthesis protein EgtB [Streptomyces nanshensis]OEV10666.1 sulfatase-modifying factor 1 [Streptomyces nanshensis]